MKRIKPVYFSDQRGFLLTFGPDDDDIYRWARGLSSDRIRQIFGIENYASIRAASGAGGVRSWMRERLRAAFHAESLNVAAGMAPTPARAGSWPERDLAIAPRVERLLETWAPEAARVIDPFAGAGLYPAIAAQRGCEAFWCEISPLQRFLSVTRFRALYREDSERRRLSESMFATAEQLAEQAARAPDAGATAMRWIADHGEWDSAVVRDLFRTAVAALLIDGEPLDVKLVANELRRHARYFSAQKAMSTPPTLLANSAADLGAMRSIGADVLLTSLPCPDDTDSFSTAAEEFLGIDGSAERRLGMAAPAATPRGRGTSLHLEHSLRDLLDSGQPFEVRGKEVIDSLVGIVREIDEPGNAAGLARYFAALVRTAVAIEHQLAAAAVAIIDMPDSWIAGRLVPNADAVRDIFGVSGFEEVAAEVGPIHRMPNARQPVRREHRVIVMRRGTRRSHMAASSGWAAWA